jgi:hypothetical protein
VARSWKINCRVINCVIFPSIHFRRICHPVVNEIWGTFHKEFLILNEYCWGRHASNFRRGVLFLRLCIECNWSYGTRSERLELHLFILKLFLKNELLLWLEIFLDFLWILMGLRDGIWVRDHVFDIWFCQRTL